jgi:hypothetical protein
MPFGFLRNKRSASPESPVPSLRNACAPRRKKTLGPVSMPKHEAQEKLAEYIEEYTGRVTKQGSSITRFTERWNVFCAVKSGGWSKKTKEDLRYLFAKHVLPIVGNQRPREVTLTSLQLLLNKMAEDGYRKSAVGQIRTYIKACFEYAVDEDLIEKNPARKVTMPNIQKNHANFTSWRTRNSARCLFPRDVTTSL